jgi:hypothetical protein
LLLAYYRSRKESINETNAAELLAVGEYPFLEKVEPIGTAALMHVITVLYNLEETINR